MIGYVLNPVLVETRGEPALTGEGCLSVPGLLGTTSPRPVCARDRVDSGGEPVTLEGEGLLARRSSTRPTTSTGISTRPVDAERRRIAMREVRESDWF